MILVQGCSFTWGQELKNAQKSRYSTLLGEMMDEQVFNIAHKGKCNFVASDELYQYLLHTRYSSNVPKPRVIIWQLSDMFRRGVPMTQFSGKWAPNNIQRELGREYMIKYQKMVLWQAYWKNKRHREKLSAEEAEKHVSEYGTGSKLTYVGPEGDKLDLTTEWAVGDTTNQYNELSAIIAIHKVQELCRAFNVQLVILNYYGTADPVYKDNAWKAINRGNYVIKNSVRWGMYNHMLWRGFHRPDNAHFDVDAHYYQAEVLYDYLTTGKQLVVEEEEHPAHEEMWPVFDYVNFRKK